MSSKGISNGMRLTLWTAAFFLFTGGLDSLAEFVRVGLSDNLRFARYGVAAICLVMWLLRPGRILLAFRESWPTFLFLVAGVLVLPSFWNTSIPSLDTFKFFASILFVVTFVSLLEERDVVNVVVASFLISLLASIAVSKLVPAYGVSEAGSEDVRSTALWKGIYVHKNVLGHAGAIGLVLAVGMLRRNLVSVTISIALLLSSVVTIWYSQSASSYVLAFVGAVFLVMFGYTRSRLGRFTLLLLPLAVLPLVAFVVESALLEKVLGLMGKDITFTGRADIWRDGLTIYRSEPIFGHGYGYSMTENIQEMLFQRYSVNHFHNSYIDLGINTGAVGVALFVGTVAWIFYRTIWRREIAADAKPHAILFACLGVCIASGFSESFLFRSPNPVSALLFTVIIGLPLFSHRSTRVGEYTRG